MYSIRIVGVDLLVCCKDLKTWNAINQGNNGKRTKTGPEKANQSLCDLNAQLFNVSIKEHATDNINAPVCCNFLLGKKAGANCGSNASHAMSCKGVTIVHPSPTSRPVGELETKCLSAQDSTKYTKEERRVEVDKSGSRGNHNQAGNGPHENGINRPSSSLKEVHQGPSQGARRSAQIGHGESHHGLERKSERRTGIKGKPRSPDDDHGQELEEGIAGSVKANVGGSSGARLTRAEDGIREVQADSRSGGTGTHVDGSAYFV